MTSQAQVPGKRVVVIGSSGHAKVVVDILEKAGHHAMVGYIDSYKPAGTMHFGYPVLGSEQALPQLIDTWDLQGYVVAVGDNFLRLQLAQTVDRLSSGRLVPVNAIHPQAMLSRGVSLGWGNVLMAGAVINADCRLENHTIVNTAASLDHDTVLEEGASLAPGARTGGNCHIGLGAAIGIGAVLAHRMRVGSHAIVGAGATVLQEVAPMQVVYGTPARAVRTRQPGDKYL